MIDTLGDLNAGETTITCTDPTPHYANGCELLLRYANGDGEIDTTEVMAAAEDYSAGIITLDEVNFVAACWSLAPPNVNNICPGCTERGEGIPTEIILGIGLTIVAGIVYFVLRK